MRLPVGSVIENVDFLAFGRYVFGTLGNEANIIIYYYLVPSRLSADLKIHFHYYERRLFSD